MKKIKKTVFVAMSGGVDSSVSAGILRDQRYNVVGVHLRCWNVDGCAEADAEDARRAAETLGIPFYVFDFENEYRQKVVDYMVEGYRKGITPNPDVMCNHEIKFGMFFKRAMEMGADYVATGHYVRLRRTSRKSKVFKVRKGIRSLDKLYGLDGLYDYHLLQAKDGDKDQSYFLWTLTQDQLKHCLFPLGDLIKKTDVRRLAKKYKLPNAEKKDSQGICFLGQVSLPEFLDQFIPRREGAIVNASGEKIGTHKGAHYFTIGQRRGLAVGGSPAPLYVAAKDIKKNIVTLAPEGDEALYSRSVKLIDMNFIAPKPFRNFAKLRNGKTVFTRVRYRQPLFRGTLIYTDKKTRIDTDSRKSASNPPKAGKSALVGAIRFAQPQKFVAVGQSAVFYDKSGRMLGGGIIASVK